MFQITFKGRMPTRNFEGSIHVDPPTSSHVYHLSCRVQAASFLGSLTRDASLIWNTGHDVVVRFFANFSYMPFSSSSMANNVSADLARKNVKYFKEEDSKNI